MLIKRCLVVFWGKFFQNFDNRISDNKNSDYHVLIAKQMLEIPLIVNIGENTWRITRESIKAVPVQYQTMKKLPQGSPLISYE